MAHVLIGFAEALPAPEVVFSLRAAGHTVSAFARAARQPLARLPLQAMHVIPAPETNGQAAADALAALTEGPGAPDLVLPLDDAGLWLCGQAGLNPARVAGASGAQATLALDKIQQIAAARSAGLAVPETHVLLGAQDLPKDLPLPAIIKPAPATLAQDGKLCKGPTAYLMDATADVTTEAARVTATGPALMQPLVHGTGEGVFGFAQSDGSVTAWSGHRRLRMMNPHGSGASACVSTQPDPATREAVSRFIAETGWRGPFMMEFLRGPDGTLWFMELNGRMWGSLALARRQGLEYPAWAVALAIDPGFRPNPPPPPKAPITLRNLGRDLLHLLFVLRGPKSAFHRERWPRFLTSLAGVLRPAPPRSFYNYDPAHRLFFLRDAAWTIGRTLRR